MICFFLLSLVFIFIYLFVFVLSQYFHISDNDTIPLKFILHYWQKLFFTLLFFFFSRVPIIGQTNTTLLTTLIYSLISTNSTLSIYLSYLYNKRESPEHRVTNPKTKKKKKKNTTGSQDRQAQIQFTITESPTSVHHSSVKTQTPQVHNHKHRLLDSEIHK